MPTLARILVVVLAAAVVPLAFAHDDGLRNEDHQLNPNMPKNLKGEMTTLKTADGKSFQVYTVGAKDAKRGILVVHEFWGLNDHIKSWADRFAAMGYRAMAVDLYDGKVATDPDTAKRYMVEVNQDAANAKLRATLEALKAPHRKIATIGWCFGGGQSLQATLQEPESVDATVIYYGPLVTDADQLSFIKGPVLGIFAKQDTFITPEKVKAFEQAMKSAGKSLEVHVYDAKHAFANPSGTAYDSAAAKQSWEVTKKFLAKNLP